jgi:methylenetetrahydrofolate--tRNA-(uracil-5-)-methyltransferase
MNVNFGLFPELETDPGGKGKERGRIRKKALADRARADLVPWLEATSAHETIAA